MVVYKKSTITKLLLRSGTPEDYTRWLQKKNPVKQKEMTKKNIISQIRLNGECMKFLLIIAHDDSFSPTKDLTKKVIAWNTEMSQRGFLIDSNPLVPSDEAVTIRIRNNKLKKTYGSFSRSHEKIAAYVLVDCSSQNEAIELAEKHPMAKAATIEVRRVWEELSSL
jgi:hypothetical protein